MSEWAPTPYGVRPTAKAKDIAPPPAKERKGGKLSSSSSSPSSNAKTKTAKTKSASTKKVSPMKKSSLHSGTTTPVSPSPLLNSYANADTLVTKLNTSISKAVETTSSNSTNKSSNASVVFDLPQKSTPAVESYSSGSSQKQRSWEEMSFAIRKDLHKITSSDISELKSLRNPPVVVKEVMAAVLTLLGEQNTSWPACVEFLGTKKVMSKLIEFNPNSATLLRVRKLAHFVERKDFTVEAVKSVSLACAAMCAWVLLVYAFKSPPPQQGRLHDDTHDSLENYDGIPREYDLLSSSSTHTNTTKQKTPKKKMTSSPATPSHLKAIQLLKSEDLGKIPLKDQLKGLHKELSEEAFEDMNLDSPGYRHFPPPQQQQQMIMPQQRAKDTSIPPDEPFYFESQDHRDLALRPPPSPPASTSVFSQWKPLNIDNDDSNDIDSDNDVHSLIPRALSPENDSRYSQKLVLDKGKSRSKGGTHSVPSPSSPSQSVSQSRPRVPSEDFTYTLGHQAGAKGGQLFQQVQQQEETEREQSKKDVAQVSEMIQRHEEDEDTALQIKFAELIIDKSRIEKSGMIGEGYFGQVWSGVWDGSLSVALKGLKHGVKNSADKNKFFSEVSSLAKMRHPNITVFYGATPPPEAYIISELLQCSLFQLIYAHNSQKIQRPTREATGGPPKPLPQKVVLRILSDVSFGGNYLHNMKPNAVIHRDLTSSNVLLTVPSTLSDEELLAACADQSKPIAKLTDFGLSREVDWCMTACVGNLFYLAPEVYTGEHYSESADIYSFGILMWEVVARESPHGGINPQRVAFLAATQNLRPPLDSTAANSGAGAGSQSAGVNISRTSERFRALTRRCWHADPLQRPSFREVSLQLQTLRNAQLPTPPVPYSGAGLGSVKGAVHTYNSFSDASDTAATQRQQQQSDPWQQTRSRLAAFLLRRPSMEQLSRLGSGGGGLITPWYLREYQEDAAQSQQPKEKLSDEDESLPPSVLSKPLHLEEDEEARSLLLPPGDKDHPLHRVLAELPEDQRAGAIHALLLKRGNSANSVSSVSSGGSQHSSRGSNSNNSSGNSVDSWSGSGGGERQKQVVLPRKKK